MCVLMYLAFYPQDKFLYIFDYLHKDLLFCIVGMFLLGDMIQRIDTPIQLTKNELKDSLLRSDIL